MKDKKIIVDFTYSECEDHNHVRLSKVEKPSEVDESSTVFVLLMALDIIANNYIKIAPECDHEKEAYKIAKHIGSFTKYLLLEGKYKKYDCKISIL